MSNKRIKTIIWMIYAIGTFLLLDITLRILTRWLGYYSIYEIAPSLFSALWALFLVSLLILFRRNVGKILYGVLFLIFLFYATGQYFYYLIFNRFFFMSDLQYAAEGTEFLSILESIMDLKVVILIGAAFVLLFIGIKLFPDCEYMSVRKKLLFVLSSLALVGIGNLVIPNWCYESNYVKYEYQTFTSSGFDMEIAGLYQYIARDFYVSFIKPKPDTSELIETVNAYLSTKEAHENNEMTGFLKGKNLIIVQVETLDDWMISEANTPFIKKLMDEGINFTDMYTACYGSGWTFGTEFAFNSGLYQGTGDLSGARLARNHFPYSIANIAKSLGYTCNSLHENTANYYNRSSAHNALGWTYHSTQDYLSSEENPMDDTTMISNDDCWSIITKDHPFCSFLITISAHLPYGSDNELVNYALKKYPEYSNIQDEVNNLLLKTRLTDDMFKLMVQRLEEDGLLDNTVIIAYGDHYSYGLSDKNALQRLSKNAGSSILEKTTAFMWFKGCEHLDVDKTCQTIDWLPTISNMFGVNLSGKVLGNDIFNNNYEGNVIFPENSWFKGGTYVNNGIVIEKGALNDAVIRETNERVQEFYKANEAILRSDYYAE